MDNATAPVPSQEKISSSPKVLPVVVVIVALVFGGLIGYLLRPIGDKLLSQKSNPDSMTGNKTVTNNSNPSPSPIISLSASISPTPVVDMTDWSSKSSSCNVSFPLPPKMKPFIDSEPTPTAGTGFTLDPKYTRYWKYSEAKSTEAMFQSQTLIKYAADVTYVPHDDDNYIKILCAPNPSSYTNQVLLNTRVMNSYGLAPVNTTPESKWGQTAIMTNFNNGEPQISPTDKYFFLATKKNIYEIYSHITDQNSDIVNVANKIIDSIQLLDP